VSITIHSANTETRVTVLEDGGRRAVDAAEGIMTGEMLTDEIILGGTPVPRLQAQKIHRLHRHLDFLRDELGATARLRIVTENSFPQGCGIASSASGFGALTLAAAAALTGATSEAELVDAGVTRGRLAHLARLGSGSAGRSFYGGYVQWSAGTMPEAQRIAPLFDPGHFPLADVICVLSDAEKAVPSTTAHRAAWSSPLFAPRLAGLQDRLDAVKLALECRDFDALGPLLEAEALEMHAVIMSSEPPVRYLTDATSRLLTFVREQRRRGALPGYFTIDAGPNVHLLCRPADAAAVAATVSRAFPGVRLLLDGTGYGPSLAVECETAATPRSATRPGRPDEASWLGRDF
jgi:diphosphomevalonate decarboxylase